MITADAMHTQRDTAEFIARCHCDYLFTVKLNQPSLRRSLASLPRQHVRVHRSTERSHGRTATRTIKAVEAPSPRSGSPAPTRSSNSAAP